MNRLGLTLLITALAAALSMTPAAAHPQQHGTTENHLEGTGAWGDLDLLGVADLTGTAGAIADVAVSPDGNYAYLAHWGTGTCGGTSEAGGLKNAPDAGTYIVDISDLQNPEQVGFIPSSQDSRPGEGVQVVDVSTSFFTGTMLVTNNEHCGPQGKGGVTLYDVTDPLKPKKLSKHFGDRGFADTHDIHSAWAWDAGDRAYVVIVDNFEFPDVDILDITNPKRPRLIAEYNLNDFAVAQPDLGLTESSIHDMVVKEIDGEFIMLVSYWDGGYVLLNVDDPANAVFLGDTDFADIDPQLADLANAMVPEDSRMLTPEGNAHQAEFTADNRFFIGTDEDFSPYRGIFEIEGVGEFPASEFGWTVPVTELGDGMLNGPTVYGGYGCSTDGIPTAEEALGSLAEGEEAILVLQRGPVGDPSASFGACFFSTKVETGQLLGYDAVIVANHHAGAQGGAAPDSSLCGSMGHSFDVQIVGVCTGHQAMHLMFGDTATYTYPETDPAIGEVGKDVTLAPVFDGWGYVHLFDANTLDDLDTFAIPEAMDPAFASGFGDLTVHEVATHPTQWDQLYLSYYAGGMRSLEIQCADDTDTSTCELVETGGYLDPEGNDFWGVEVFVTDDGRTIVLGSDRDSGLWIFEDTDVGTTP